MQKFFLLLCLSTFLISSPARAEALAEPAKKVDLSMLTTDEVQTYQYGKISDASLVGGGLLGTFIGLGTGHIVEGQYGRRGWIFTAGELGSYVLMAVGLASEVNSSFDCAFGGGSSCSNNGTNGLLVVGLVGYLGFRVWEIIDVWTTPGRVNAEYDAIKARVESGPSARPSRAEMMLAPMILAAERNGKSPMGLQFLVRF